MSLALLLLPNVLYLFAKLLGWLAGWRVPYRSFLWTAVGLVVLWWVMALYGFFIGRFRWEVKAWEYDSQAVPVAYDGYRIVQLSDIHSGGWRGHEQVFAEIVEQVNSLHPDLICFTGDLVDISAEDMHSLTPYLQRLVAKDGIISIMGNHDYLPYARFASERERRAAIDKVIAYERDTLRWTLLLNEHLILRRGNDSIAILGCENQSVGAHPVIQRGNLLRTMQGTDGMMRILLTHDPSQWRAEVVRATDIPLTLSGHTHAMQMRLFGFTPSRWIYPECDGLYREDNQQLYVNIGLGGTMHMRIGANPEVTLLTLKRSK